jgi:ABC-2 type transport system permease protein
MRQMIALATKDLRILLRRRSAFFFTLIWPVVVAVLFGFAFGGPAGGKTNAIKVALVDEDATDASRAFVARLQASGHFDVRAMARPEAETAVRQGARAAFLVIRHGFGARSTRMFYGPPREIEVGQDPSRQAEAAMIEGLLMQAAADDMQRLLTDQKASQAMADEALASARSDPGAPPELTRFLGELRQFVGSPASAPAAGGAGGEAWQPLRVTSAAVVRERTGPANAFEITFPQGVLWGLIGCMMSFGVSLVSERTRGTFVRLQMAPLSRRQILGGKALACFLSMLVVQALLYGLGYAAFGVRPSSWPLLGLATLSVTVAFCGLMMLVATLGETEQTASSTAWAFMMPLSMLGGGMIPQFIMPAWMNTVGVVSPMRWAIRAMEGALWRQFSLAEMVLPCAILWAVGVACFALGSRRLAAA